MHFINSKKVIRLVLILAIGYGVGISFWRNYNFEKHAKFTIGKLESFQYQGSNAYADFYFYHKNQKIEGSTYVREQPNDFWVNKYFKVEYSSENPEINEILLDEMVTDADTVREAGFKLASKMPTDSIDAKNQY